MNIKTELSEKDIQNLIRHHYSQFSDLPCEKIAEKIQASGEEINQGPLDTQKISQLLKNPYSVFSLSMAAYVVQIWTQDQQVKQIEFVRFLRNLLTEAASPPGAVDDDSNEEIDAEQSAAFQTAQISEEIEDLIKKSKERQLFFDDLFKAYTVKSSQLIALQKSQREVFNDALKKADLTDVRFELTPEKQANLQQAFSETQTNFEKLNKNLNDPQIIKERDLRFEIKFMAEMTAAGENSSLKPSDVVKLSKAGLFGLFRSSEHAIQAIKTELNLLDKQLKTCAEDIELNFQEQSARYRPAFSQAKNEEELLDKLEKMYSVIAKNKTAAQTQTHFEFGLAEMVKKMLPDEQAKFFRQVDRMHELPLTQIQQVIFAASANVCEEIRPEAGRLFSTPAFKH